jgi:DNA polymerase-3 subunit epsilon
VQEFIDKNVFENKTIVITDRGRTIHERSAVLIENGIYKGYAFYDLNYQIRNIEILKNMLTPMENNRDTRTIIQSQIRRSKSVKLLYF